MGYCGSCQPGYLLQAGICYLATCNIYGCTQCMSWNSPVLCMQCQQGLVLSDGYCVQMPCTNNVTNCVSCVGNGTCQACAQGYNLLNSTGNTSCVAAPAFQNCSIPHCITCSQGNPGQCSQCAAQYKLINGQCYCNFQNCLDCSSSSLMCDLCPLPLQASMFEAGCTPAPSLRLTCTVSDCSACLTETQCAICTFGFQLTAAFTCVQNNCTALGLSNCQICDKWGITCQACQPGFMPSNLAQGGQCLPINPNYTCSVPGCSACSSTDNQVCVACLPTYTFNELN